MTDGLSIAVSRPDLPLDPALKRARLALERYVTYLVPWPLAVAMGYVVRMPQLGMTMESGTVVEWPVAPGETFDAGSVIAIVESEKTTNEIEAREAGTIIEQFVDIDQEIEPGHPIAYVDEPGSSIPESVIEETKKEDQDAITQERVTADPSIDTKPESATEHKISPRARTYANAQGISTDQLESVQGTGPGGAIIERDLIDISAEAERIPQVDGRDIYERVSANPVRSAIAKKMVASAREAPQVTIHRQVCVAEVLNLKDRLESDLDERISVTDFFINAVARSLVNHPKFNAIYSDGEHHLARNVNISVAVAIDDGLITPVIANANDLSLQEIAKKRKELVELAKSGAFTMDDLANGTFTITNLGHFGVEKFDPLLNVPEVAILGIGTIKEVPVTADGRVHMEPHIDLSLTFDHRAVDGANAARFLDSVVTELDHPLGLMPIDRTSSAWGEIESEETTGKRSVTVHATGQMTTTVRSRKFKWQSDEPTAVGGENAAPTPVEQFLGSLASCLSVTINAVADRRDVDLATVEISISGEPEDGPLESLSIQIDIESPADEETVKKIIETAERACYVSRVISDTIERTVELSIRTP